MSVLDDFGSWKEFLADRIKQAEQDGMNEETIHKVAHEIGDYLAQNVAAPNKEVSTLQDLWNVATEEEQEAITNTMIKLVQKDG